jgi:hypothetical protein
LNAETVLDLIEDRMETEERQFWARHIQGCPDCTTQIAEWESLRALIQRSHLENAPPEAIDAASGLFSKKPETPPESRLRLAIATVIFDSFTQPAFAGARGTAESRQIVLRTDELDIHIRISGDFDHRNLLGQLLPRGTPDFAQRARLHLLKNGERFQSTEADDLGEFRFTDVPDGLFSLQVDLPNLTVIGSLNITSPR